MDSFRRLKSWTPKARRARKQEQQTLGSLRAASIWQLQTAFGQIAESKDIQLSPAVIETYPITVEDLNLDDAGYTQAYAPCFFQPLTQGELGDHPLDLDHKAAKDKITTLEKFYGSDKHRPHSDMSRANSISIDLQGLFGGYERIGIGGQRSTLRELTGWVPGPLVRFNDDFERSTSWSLKWTLGDTWIRSDDSGRPHCMMSLVHWCPPQEDLLQGEVLAIMAAMIARLRDPTPATKDHLVIPVMVFSCMGGWKARILQAHPDQSGIVIRKTANYDFSTWEKAKGSFDVFLRFMSSTPAGDTRQLPVAPAHAPVPAREEPPTDTRRGVAGTTRHALPFRKRPGIDTGGYTGATIRPVVPSGQGTATHTGADPIVSAPPTISPHEEQAHESKAADVQTRSQPSDTGSSPGTANIDLRSEGANSELRSEPSNAAESQLRQVFTEP